MIVGTTIIHDGTGTTAYYTPSFPRGGLAATFAFDVTHKSGSPTMTITIEHKNADETSWSTAVAIASVTSVGVETVDFTGLKEEVRIAFTFSSGSAGNFYHVVIPAPSWRPY